MKTRLINKTFKTPLGIISCSLNSNYTFKEIESTGDYENGSFEKFITSAYNIELIEFKIEQPLYNGETISDSKCWIWRIKKIKEISENIELDITITDFSKDSKFDFAYGENLDAFEVSDNKWKLHVGTEDGEILNYRAENDNWFPIRLVNAENHSQDISWLKKSSISTKIPELKIGEKIHLQYLIAINKQNLETVNTWLAVDKYKSDLEKWIGIK